MPSLVNAFDPYERKARLYPMLLALLPIGLAAASWMPADVDVPSLLGGFLGSVVLASLLGQLARDLGREREPELFKRWGGMPSDQALSYSAARFDPATLRRVHANLRELDGQLALPADADDEASRPEEAQAAYASASELLLARTRDKAKHGLVFEENVNYGYRRNLWAMKPTGLTVTILGGAACVTRLAYAFVTGVPVTWSAAVGAFVCISLAVVWWRRITADWVLVTAQAFARQMVLAGQTLSSKG